MSQERCTWGYTAKPFQHACSKPRNEAVKSVQHCTQWLLSLWHAWETRTKDKCEGSSPVLFKTRAELTIKTLNSNSCFSTSLSDFCATVCCFKLYSYSEEGTFYCRWLCSGMSIRTPYHWTWYIASQINRKSPSDLKWALDLASIMNNINKKRWKRLQKYL